MNLHHSAVNLTEVHNLVCKTEQTTDVSVYNLIQASALRSVIDLHKFLQRRRNESNWRTKVMNQIHKELNFALVYILLALLLKHSVAQHTATIHLVHQYICDECDEHCPQYDGPPAQEPRIFDHEGRFGNIRINAVDGCLGIERMISVAYIIKRDAVYSNRKRLPVAVVNAITVNHAVCHV